MQPSIEETTDKRKNTIRSIIIAGLLIINVLVVYLYYYVLIFNSVEIGEVYGESTYNGGQYEIYTLKYFYKHGNNTHFDKIDYVMNQDLSLGDSLELRVFKPYPKKHRIQKVFRDESIKQSYDCNEGLTLQYNSHINNISDYESHQSKTIKTPRGNRLIIGTSVSNNIIKEVESAIDKIIFNHGTVIDYYILNVTPDTITLHSIYHYLNDYTTDVMPSRVIHNELSKKLPNKHFHISIIDKNTPKKEQVLVKN